jgi:hypothetical protein
VADLPPPEETKALTVPPDNGFRPDDHQDGSPVGPHSCEPDPEEPIGYGEFEAPGRGTPQDSELVTQGKVLQPECGRGLEQCREGGEQYEQEVVH